VWVSKAIIISKDFICAAGSRIKAKYTYRYAIKQLYYTYICNFITLQVQKIYVNMLRRGAAIDIGVKFQLSSITGNKIA